MDQKTLVEQLKALGEANRLTVAVRLADREWGAGELLAQLGMSQPSLSRHLKVLREAGVIRERRTGRNAYYQLVDDELPRLVATMALSAAARDEASREGQPVTGHKKMPEQTSVPPEPDDPQPRTSSIEEWLL